MSTNFNQQVNEISYTPIKEGIFMPAHAGMLMSNWIIPEGHEYILDGIIGKDDNFYAWLEEHNLSVKTDKGEDRELKTAFRYTFMGLEVGPASECRVFSKVNYGNTSSKTFQRSLPVAVAFTVATLRRFLLRSGLYDPTNTSCHYANLQDLDESRYEMWMNIDDEFNRLVKLWASRSIKDTAAAAAIVKDAEKLKVRCDAYSLALSVQEQEEYYQWNFLHGGSNETRPGVMYGRTSYVGGHQGWLQLPHLYQVGDELPDEVHERIDASPMALKLRQRAESAATPPVY